MAIWVAIILGIIQGIFMFFPVSSTSHLVLAQHWLLHRGEELPPPESAEMILFDLVVHLGTLVSIALVFRSSLYRFCFQTWNDTRAFLTRVHKDVAIPLYLRLFLLGMFSVFVTGVVGLSLKPVFEQAFAHPLAICATLTITGILLYWTDTMKTRPRGLRDFTIWMALVIGLAQAFALVPGFSRSGLTIAFALFLGLKRRWAAEYSFFIAFPTIIAASGVQTLHFLRSGEEAQIGMAPLLTGFIVAAIVGAIALTLVLKLLYRANFRFFSYYVWAMAGLILVGTLMNWFPALH